MALVVVLSNILVQFPVQGQVGRLALADLLTWGAFTYPLAFLVTDLANRRYGPSLARRVVFVGFALAVATTVVFPPLLFRLGLIPFELEPGRLVRVAIASGTAFLVGQLLDVSVFNRLRQTSWWRAPVVASIVGSIIDTAIFFTVAFAAAFAFVGPSDAFSLEAAPLLGLFEPQTARWISWALGDLSVKLIIAVVALIPYRLITARWWNQPLAA
ncbi:queuosine precursor transporter [Tianweitania sediminis]|uniref:Probable queuosine precursor transporter n=2 Tax=Tianweitania sediminis TaxID=1502156 RepID=A0A8J7QZS1_9HYPH|nr:queuosine precursor transporter [Tianweitania sediminis]